MNKLTKRLITFCIALLVCAVESFGALVRSVLMTLCISTNGNQLTLPLPHPETGLSSNSVRELLVSGVMLMGQERPLLDNQARGLTAVMQNLEILEISNNLISELQIILVMTRN